MKKSGLKMGSSKSGESDRCDVTLRLEKILTTAGAAFLTTGAKERVMTSWDGGICFSWARTTGEWSSKEIPKRQAVTKAQPLELTQPSGARQNFPRCRRIALVIAGLLVPLCKRAF